MRGWIVSTLVVGVVGCTADATTPVEEARSADHVPSAPAKSTSTAPDPPAGQTDTTPLKILPATIFSGIDGVHTFEVPLAVYGATEVELTASDGKAIAVAGATITDPNLVLKDKGAPFILTMKEAGVFTLTATASNGRTATAKLTVTKYAPARYDIGLERYMNDGSNGQPACTSCHGKPDGPDHSPTALAAVQDEAIRVVVTTGILAEGHPITQVKHKWQVSNDELDGLVTYLRALPPRGYEVTP